MNNTQKKLIEEYYTGSILNLDTTKLVNHDVVYYRKNDENSRKVQKTVKDAFKGYIKVDETWLSVFNDIVLLFVIEKVIPEVKATEYSGTKIHNEQAETAKRIQEAFKHLEDEKKKTDWFKPFIPPPFYPNKFPPPSSKCRDCGLELSGVMCYSCPRANCPCGMGPTMCHEYRPEESPHRTTITDGTNVCCGGNCSSAESLP